MCVCVYGIYHVSEVYMHYIIFSQGRYCSKVVSLPVYMKYSVYIQFSATEMIPSRD